MWISERIRIPVYINEETSNRKIPLTLTNNRNMTINGLFVNVNGCEERNDNDLADTIVHRFNDMLNEDGSVWGK